MTLALKYKLEAGPHGDVVLGKSRQVPRGMAINMLPSSRLPNAVALLSKVLESETEDSASRRLAAINLWRMNSPEAHSEASCRDASVELRLAPGGNARYQDTGADPNGRQRADQFSRPTRASHLDHGEG